MEKTTNEIRKVLSYYGRESGLFKRKDIKSVGTKHNGNWVSYYIKLDKKSQFPCVHIQRYTEINIVAVELYHSEYESEFKTFNDLRYFDGILTN